MPRNLTSTERAQVNRAIQHHNREVQNFHRALGVRVRDLLLLLPLHVALNLFHDREAPYFKEWPLWFTLGMATGDALSSWFLGPLILDGISYILWCKGSRDATYWPVVYTRGCAICLEVWLLYDLGLLYGWIYLLAAFYSMLTGAPHFGQFAIVEGTFTSLRFILSVKNFNNELQIFMRLGHLQGAKVILDGLNSMCHLPGRVFGTFSWPIKALVVNAHMWYKKRKEHLTKMRQRQSSERFFLEACETGDKVAMRSLLTEHGDFLNVNIARNQNGDTGLHLACRGGYETIAESLLDVKKKVVNVNIENSSGETPLMIAAGMGHTIIVRRLLKAKGLKLKEEYGEKSILKAVENDHYETAKQILTTIVNKEGITTDKRLRNMLDYLQRCVDLSKKAEAAKSQVERQKHTLSLDIYKKSIVDILKPTDFSGSQSTTNKKTFKEYVEDLKEFLECSICFDQFEDLKIFACINDHWICMRCLPQNESCPFCRVDFDQHPPARRITSEKFLQILVNVKSDQ